MASVEVFVLWRVLPRGGEAPRLSTLVFAASVLLGSAGFLLALLWSYSFPGLNSATILLAASGIGMGFPPGLWMIATVVARDRRIDLRDRRWPFLLAGTTLGSELLMGVAFAGLGGAPTDLAGWIGTSLTSPWYLGSMAAAMLALLLVVPVESPSQWALGGLAASGLAAPWVLWDPIVGALLLSAAMVPALGAVVAVASRGRPGIGALRTVSGVLAGFGVMGVAAILGGTGLFAVGAPVPFGIAMTTVMGAELLFLVDRGFRGARRWPEPRDAGPAAGTIGVGAPPG